jgi:hypothetical protein
MTEKIETTELEEETVTTQDKKEKLLSQEEVNKLIAKERREWKSKLDTLQTDYDSFRGEVEAKEAKLQDKNKIQVETLKKDLPEQVIKLLDKLTIEEQLEYLEDESNKLQEKKRIPPTPEGKDKDSKPVKTIPTPRF